MFLIKQPNHELWNELKEDQAPYDQYDKVPEIQTAVVTASHICFINTNKLSKAQLPAMVIYIPIKHAENELWNELKEEGLQLICINCIVLQPVWSSAKMKYRYYF